MNNLIMIENLEKYELSSFWNDGKKHTKKQHAYASTLKLSHLQSNNIMHTCIFM